MSFYIITEGAYQIEEIFWGRTKREVVYKARSMINQWPEYVGYDYQEIIDLAEAGRMEFDLVEVEGDIPSPSVTKAELISIYERQ